MTHQSVSISSTLTVHLTSFYFHLFSLPLVFRLLVMLSPSPHGKVNVYLSPKGAVYSSVFPSSSLCRKPQCEPSQLASPAAPYRTYMLRLDEE